MSSLRLFLSAYVLGAVLTMAGRSNTFYLGAQANAQQNLELGLTFEPHSLRVDNPGPQQIIITNPPLHVPAYTVGLTHSITSLTNRVVASAIGTAKTGLPASVTFYEDDIGSGAGSTTQTPFSATNTQVLQFSVGGTAASLVTSTQTVPAGNYSYLGLIFSLAAPVVTNVGLSVSTNVGPVSINTLSQPTVAITFPAPVLLVSTGAPFSFTISKSDATTFVLVFVTIFIVPAPN